jgi:probable F420-dependent oxidoreductase
MAAEQQRTRVGLQLPQAGPNAQRQFVTEFVQHARAAGIRSFWVGEHIVMGDFRHRAKTHELFLEPLVLLAFIAGADPDVELGTSVLVVPYRNPLVLLKGLSTLAHLTGRRVIVGVGAGWAEEEFDAVGAAFHRRGHATDEFCEIFHRLRNQGEDSECWRIGPISYRGRGFQPLPSPLTELWVGGNSIAARRRAARFGSGWQPTGLAPDEVRAGMDEVRAFCEAHGRDPAEVVSGLRLRVRVTPEAARDELPALFAAYREAGVTDFLCEVNTRDRGYTLEAIPRLVESFKLAAIDV